ncbi:hypothetical protein HD600_002218 [Microbacterium ginsengiterrae]|uniref:DUF4012 domain-containing protein n=1 Tax=Microbacterium ginsengiterrae TaxID=546115 RepID=A0A7W9CDV6_9MICO|nr:DUF4012 domain-containing protein [Microbacterium ginsengiterrae]MBB5743721.1 hypothetical protein [Microbacterium ginsengiterrae]
MSDGRLPARRRWVGGVIGLLVVAALLATAWVVIRALGSASELQSVRSSTAQLRSALADGELDRAERIAPRIAAHAALARDLTSDPVWRAFEFVPWLGANMTAMREVAEVTDAAADAAAGPIVLIADSVDPATLGFTGSRIDLAPLPDVHAALEGASIALHAAQTASMRIDVDAALPPVADAVREAQVLIRDVATTVGALHGAAGLLPGMLGGEEPRNYLIALQNNAEARSHGGAIVAFTLVRADNGVLANPRTVSAQDLTVLDSPPLPLDDATTTLFGDSPGRSVRDATSIPDFPSAAEIVAQHWQQQYGDVVDGVVALDLVAAEHLVGAIGSLSFGEHTADADTLVTRLASEVSVTNPQPVGRDAALAQAGGSLVSALLVGEDPAAVLAAVATASTDDRIRVWSAHEEEQKQLETSGLSGRMPSDGERGTHVSVLVNDASGGVALDAHAHASISTAVGACRGEPTTQVRVTWSNDVPADLAATAPASDDLAAGQTRTLISIVGPEGASVSGGDVAAELGVRPVAQYELVLSPGESSSVTASFTGTGAGDRRTQLHHTPLLDAPDVAMADLECG